MTQQEIVFFHLARLRKGYVRSRGGLFSLGAVAGVAGVVLSFCVADLVFHLPTFLCWLCWLGLLGTIGAGIYAVRHVLKERVSDEAMAVLVERVMPDVDNHVINAVQLSGRYPQSDSLVEGLLKEVAPDWEGIHHRSLYSQDPLKWIKRGLIGMGVVGGLLFALTPRGMTYAVGRLVAPMAGLEPFTLTRIISVTPEDPNVLRGESVDVEVRFEGATPKNARVIWERGKGKAEEVPLGQGIEDGEEAPSGDSHFCRLKGVFYDSKFRVAGGDAKSRWYTISVTNPPGLDSWEAMVVPPKYLGQDQFRLDEESQSMDVPVGAKVGLIGKATCGLSVVELGQDESVLATAKPAGRSKFKLKFRMMDGGAPKVKLTADSGLESSSSLPFVVVLDQRPSVVLVDTKQRILASKDAQVPLAFRVEDDHGVVRVGLLRLLEEEQSEEVTSAIPDAVSPTFAGRFIVDLPTFGAREGDTLRFRVWAEDNGPDAVRRRGRSTIVHINIPVPEDRRKAKKKVVQQAKDSLLALIKMQRENLKNTRRLSELSVLGKKITSGQINGCQVVQKTIRDSAGALLADRAALGDLANVLSGLVDNEMAQVLEVFEEAHRAGEETVNEKLTRCVSLETHILAALTGIPTSLGREQNHQEKTDLFAALQKMVGGQRKNLKVSKEAQAANADAGVVAGLAEAQDQLANDLITFTDQCLVLIEERVDDDFAKQIRQVYDLIEKDDVYSKMLAAAEALEESDLAAGIQSEEEALRVLLRALDILNIWRMKNAQKIVKEAAEVIKETADRLEQLEAKQAQIAEVTRDLAARGALDDDARKKLAEMDEEQKEMAKMLEEMAQDLYQFPELPVCNELNSKMREIYEDVEQALDSENAPAIEIAVQKEDSILDAIRNTKERVEDVEMWLPDVPDNIVWNMESFDTDEFPEIPLVPLPDELEDIVGDLLDQASSVEQQAQDTTGNNIIADTEMGWGIMDGPMPSFSAKGKSGNQRPNDNEMTGRSGAGREGQATGELVENHVKGLEGRKTHARRTQDPFQKGMVTEDEDSTMDARSTGGGKLGGESESGGMFGKAPRRDLHTEDHGMTPMKLRQETEALYATARLLYLGTGSLGTAARTLRGIEMAPQKMKKLGSLHRRVLRRLEDTQVELANGVVLPMPVASVSKTGGAVSDDVDINQISEEYRDIVSDYYRSLETE
ncbi:MAG: hypothetical protein HN742_06195 [Lentisphaerae bacterium]|jgi:hypothetical protein|nr:hypothetical protein [Lentisphaerota bacterium]MBT4821899.1 hypothetical protein [Lentisphaerota bacterium]MBT5609996.1 hypothetical protein [Lentisphaerota bacterium]MBT7059119.1 hypothetical protein [Lentisphaerota bacterium]MBT7841441.1 hypothetical protein [Lentisphaerota bacterium]